ncbi:MAG: hypothetical protein K0Q59_1427 [Paenibacillus sp.]|jgi:ABC-2 type transport system permease protein|nr:hypothetical protein [Paenibacillus sp.]
MGTYWEIMKLAFKQNFAYRMNSLITATSAIFGMVVLVSIWSTLFHNKEEVQGVQLPVMISYVIISAVIGSLIDSSIHTKIGERVEDGSLSLDFIKPISFKLHLFAEQIGENVFRFLFNTLPACVLVALVWGFQLPDEPYQVVFFLITLINGLLLHYYFNFILGLIVFYLESSFFIEWVSTALFQLFAGSFVPLWFYPAWLYNISMFLPFRLFTFEPISIFVGKTDLHGAVWVVILQLMWLAVFVLVEKWLWRRAQTIVDIHGG